MRTAVAEPSTDTRLVDYFRRFYAIVVRYKHQIRSSYEVTPAEIFATLRDYLEHFAAADHSLDQRMYTEARYAMAALADEIFLNLPWDGAREWTNRLLENELFSSCICGELLFEKIRDHLQTAGENRPPIFHSLSTVYLYVLSLGFEGRFRNRGNGAPHPELMRFRRALYASAREVAGEFAPGSELFPGADARIPGVHIHERLPDARRWQRILIGAVLAYLFVSTAVWFVVTRDLSQTTSEIVEEQEESPAG